MMEEMAGGGGGGRGGGRDARNFTTEKGSGRTRLLHVPAPGKFISGTDLRRIIHRLTR